MILNSEYDYTEMPTLDSKSEILLRWQKQNCLLFLQKNHKY